MGPFLRLFGGLRLEPEDVALSGRAAQKKRLALLALLGSSRTGRLSRDKLAALLWPESDAEHARHLLASSVYELRRALGEEAIATAGDELRLNREVLASDVVDFEVALAAGDREEAIAIYAGPFLDGFFVPEAAEFERWVDGERARLAQAYGRALEQLAQQKAAANDLLGAVELWRRLAAHDPYNSRVALALIRALEAAGDRAAALQHARIHTTLLRHELDAAPDPEITALAERLRTGPVNPRPPNQPAAASSPAPGAGESLGAGDPTTTAPLRPQSQVPSDSPPRARWRIPALLVALAAAVIVGSLATYRGWRPVVVMMDSPHPSRVYDDEVIQASGTNADVLNDVLRDLPIQRVKEAAGPFWHRHEEIRQLDPDLVIIHLSAFCTEECEPDRIRLRRFIEYLADSDTRFLIYSRMPPDTLAAAYRTMLGDLPQRFPSLAARLSTFSLTDHGTPHWKDPATAAALKLRVKELLDLR